MFLKIRENKSNTHYRSFLHCPFLVNNILLDFNQVATTLKKVTLTALRVKS